MNGGAAATGAASSTSAGRFTFSSFGTGGGGGLGSGLGNSLGTGLGSGLGTSSKPPMYPGSSAFGLGLGGYGLSAPTGGQAGPAGGMGLGAAPGAPTSSDFSLRRRSSNPMLDDGALYIT